MVSGVLRFPRQLVVLVIRGYQRFISPALPPACRFTPSCSQYTLEAVRRYGVVRGGRRGRPRAACYFVAGHGGLVPGVLDRSREEMPPAQCLAPPRLSAIAPPPPDRPQWQRLA